GSPLRECLRRLEENNSYLIFTCSREYDLPRFEREARESSGEASVSELRDLWASVRPRVPLKDVFQILPNRGSRIARTLNAYWGSGRTPGQPPRRHVSAHVRPRFLLKVPKS